jgi:succinate dehydrogenase flavin-adding protein (antitoxin of CptAB toxin-antitoxin module)
MDILLVRLKKARSYKGVVAAREMDELIDKLARMAENLNDDNLSELRSLLNEEELAGLVFRMRPAILALCEEMTKP